MINTKRSNNLSDETSSDKYLDQITHALYQNASGAIAGSVINIALVAYVLADAFPGVLLLVWFIAGQLLNAVRWFFLSQHETNPERFQTNTWLNIHRLLTLLSGSLYGVLALFFFNSENPIYQVLVMLLVGGMGAAAVGTHGVDKLTFRLFMLSAILPLIARCLFEATEIHSTMAIMLGILILIMIKAGNQTHQIMTENFEMSESLRYRATHDSLVGLLNREEFEKAYEERSSLSKTTSSDLQAIIFIDLDNFKALNDTLGHQAGDQALIEIGDIIRQCIRKTDIAARFGGDEFMIMLESNNLDEPKLVANKVLERINQYQHKHEEFENISVGASIGIGYSEGSMPDFTSLLRAADSACYQAKHSGKGRICSKAV